MAKTPIEGQDFKYVKAKMPLRDKDGNDVSGDKMGAGGRRKKNGQQSVQAYDFEDLPPEEDYSGYSPDSYGWYEPEESHSSLQDLALALDAANGLLDTVSQLLRDNPEIVLLIRRGGQYVASKARASASWIKGAVRKKPKKQKRQEKPSVPVKKADHKATPSPSTERIVEEPVSTHQQSHRIFMSREEALQELFTAIRSYITLKNSIDKLANANYVDIEALGFNGVIAQLEAFTQQFSAALNAPEQNELYGLLNSGFSDTEKERALLTLGLPTPGESNAEDATKAMPLP